MNKWATNPAVHNIGINRMAIAKAAGTSSQFQTKLVKPLVPLLTTLHLRAKQILHLARHVSVFHAQSVHIAKQALNLVILLNNLIDAEDVPDDEQHKERDDLEDDLVELYDAMMKWGSQAGENEQANYAERRLKIQKQYLQMFKQRFYFDVCDASTDIDYQISLAYDEKTILFRQSQHDPVIGSFTIDVDHWDARDMEDRVNNTACGSQPGFAPAPSGSQHTPRENVKGSEVGNPLHGVTSDSHLLLSGDATVVPFSTLAKDPEVIPLIQDGSKCAPYKMTDDNNIPGSAHNAQNQEKEERRGQMKPKSLLASDYPPLEPGSPSFTEYELAAATVAHDPMKNHAYDPRDSESQADDNLRRRGTNLRPTRRFSRDTAPMPMFASALDTPTSPPSSAQAHRKVRRKPVRQLEDTPSEYFKWEPGVEPLVLVSPSEETMPIMGSTGRRNRSIGIYRDAPSSATVPANVQATYSRLSQGKGRHRTAIKESHSRQEIDDYDDDRDNRGQERRLDPTSEKDTSFMGRVRSRSNSLTKAITKATLVYPKYLASKINPARRENKQSAAGGSSGVLVHSEHRRGTTDIESFDVNYGYSPSTRTDINTINTDATVVSAGTTANTELDEQRRIQAWTRT
ncbi:hypothetical protein M408DRAFT_25581 [Serendipita vermifera MAFF 305830]|uniref:Uncharacterized protein n=1 Tax=Serendipita vermifera MAFF 305830 TaxID=933852 RepID=A0A0C2XAD8_SERVB|nr:hypothetical protein M408DRAFT_25581 [Serendipita vermifera MAFF 305830]